LIFLGAFAVLLGPYRQLASFEVLRMAKCWLLFVVIINECVREKHFQCVLLALVANVAANIAVAAAQFVLKRELGLQPLGEASEVSTLGANLGVYGTPDSSVYRVGGLLGHANLLSAYLALLLPILLGQIFTNHTRRMKLLLAAVSGGGLICLILTLSRSGWVSFAVAVLVLTAALFALPALRKRHMLLKAGFISSLVAALAVASGPIIRRLTESDPGALDFRREWVGVAWDMVKDRPVFGVGLNSFIYNLLEFAPYDAHKMSEIFGDLWPAVHNIYMLVWSEQGTLGLLLFAALHVNLFWIGIRNLRYRGLSEKVYLLNIGAMCGILAIMIDGLSSFYVRVPGPARAFWVVVGLLVAAHYWNARNDAARRQQGTGAAA
jgi:O-antigen ligase